MKLLVIDDDKDLLEVTKSLLTRKGFEVETNDNWDDALHQLESFEPQLILLDVFLNGIDGLDICKKLKSMPNTCHIPILIFSAYPSIAERVIYEYGADDFIAKPFEVSELVTKVHSVLSQPAGMA
jgi:DNA-binding response OmpR family regulator